MTTSPTVAPDADPLPVGPPPFALMVAQSLVTRYRLRLTDPADSRLGPLGGGRYLLGAAAWTGRVAAFVGFFIPPAVGAQEDLEARVRDAYIWGEERIRTQGLSGAERCAVLLVALGALGTTQLPQVLDAPVRVGVVSVDVARQSVEAHVTPPPGLPGVRDLRRQLATSADPAKVPTLAAVDLAERQTVQGGYAAPARRAMTVTQPYVAYALVGLFVLVYIVQKLTDRSSLGGTLVPMYEAAALSTAHPGDWWTYITTGFVHEDNNLLHIVFNGGAMVILGGMVERLHGRLVLLGTFLLSVVGSSAMVILADRAGISTSSGAIGASGGIFGLVGLLLMLGRVQGRNVPVGIVQYLRQYAMSMVVIGVVVGLLDPHISNTGHLGGFLTGVLVGLVLPPLVGVGGRDLRLVEKAAIVAVAAVSVVALGVGAQHLVDTVNALDQLPAI